MSDIVTREEWLQARKALLAKEKAFTKERDRLSAERRALPQVRVEEDYLFQGEDGEVSLAGLFGPHRQLVIYHFMFGADWAEGCPSCSFWADNFDGIDVHLAARDTAFAAISIAPLEKLLAYRKRMGWRFRWVSSAGNNFNMDYGVTFPGGKDATGAGYNYSGKVFSEELPGTSVFMKLDDGGIAHSYSTYGRGLDIINGAYHILDLTPRGRDEDALDFTQAWVRRRDQYAP